MESPRGQRFPWCQAASPTSLSVSCSPRSVHLRSPRGCVTSATATDRPRTRRRTAASPTTKRTGPVRPQRHSGPSPRQRPTRYTAPRTAPSGHRVPFVRGRLDDAAHELQRLLIQMRGRVPAGVVHPRSDPAAVAPVAFRAVEWRVRPDVRQSVLVAPWMAEPRPFRCTDGSLPVNRIIWTPRGVTVLVREGNEPAHHLRRREIPEPVLCEVLAGGGVLHSARLVGSIQRHPGPLPFRPQPLAGGHRAARGHERQSPPVEDTDLGHGRQPADRVPVHVAGNVTDALVPQDRLDILPAFPRQKRMHGRPADLGIPEPQRRGRMRAFRPGNGMVGVPRLQSIRGPGVSRKPTDTVCAIGHDQVRGVPVVVDFLGRSRIQRAASPQHGNVSPSVNFEPDRDARAFSHALGSTVRLQELRYGRRRSPGTCSTATSRCNPPLVRHAARQELDIRAQQECSGSQSSPMVLDWHGGERACRGVGLRMLSRRSGGRTRPEAVRHAPGHPSAPAPRSIRSRCACLATRSRNEPSIEFRIRVTRSCRPSSSASATATKLSSR